MKYWIVFGQFLLAIVVQADQLSLLSAEGFGFADVKRFPESQARLMAVRAARIDAQRNLLETINGVQVTAGTTVKDMALESDIVGTRVKGMLQGAFELSSSVDRDGDSLVASVTMAVCLGKDNAACKERKTLVAITQPNLKSTEKSKRFQINDLAMWDCAIGRDAGGMNLVDQDNVGLFTHTITEGTGTSPSTNSIVELGYVVSIRDEQGECKELDRQMGEFKVKSLIEGFRVALPKMKAGGEVALHMAPWLGFKTSRSNGLQPETNLYARLKLIKVLETGADTSDSAINGSGEIAASPSEQQQESIEDLQSRQSGLVIDASDLDFAPMLDVRVKTEGDKELYGPSHVPMGSDWLHWAASIEAATDMVEVIGANPIVVKPVRIGEASELVVSDADAISLFTSNTVSGDYLGAGKVIIVVSGS